MRLYALFEPTPAGLCTISASVLAAFVKAGLVKSNGEARQIAGGGLRVNDTAVTDAAARLTQTDVRDGGDQAVARQEAPRAAAANVTVMRTA